ncbi:septation protein SepH [Cellulosimicrobium sp. CUA-896]|uniref:septation protein SepH n=1 Tax=Cellulosimicrobium sp. CUA-896 TaxID=1517881 RepID=UPI000966B4FE|nr:septation protein SepH [Cellulosimicrobium sp. CUA-896]OLT53070.1 hypothetical protein BJF88_01535 [Cellulosimicrobium sp. CUA-896]
MDELQLVRLHEDGEHLVLGGEGGARFVLPISEALRAAVRRDRPHLEHLRAEDSRRLSPREIQSRLRAGEGVEEVAEAAGLAVEQVRRFAGPVLAEQEYVVERVRASRPGHEDDAPTVEELTARRLASRDVDLAGVEWSAARQPGAPWVVTVAFTVASGRSTARWSYDASSRALHALDDEARWISQPEPAPQPAAVGADVFDVDSAAPRRHAPRRAAEADGTADLLDDLGRRRGVRPRSEPARSPAGPDLDGQEPFEGFGPLAMLDGADDHDHREHHDHRDDHDHEDDDRDGDHEDDHDGGPGGGATVVRLPSVRPASRPPAPAERDGADRSLAARRAEDVDADVPSRTVRAPASTRRATAPEEPADGGPSDAPAATRAGSRETRKGRGRSRAKVPSWDEIVFGARPEH